MAKKRIPEKFRKRYLPIKGDKARRVKDRYTGKIYSRRYYDTKIRRVKRVKGKPATEYKKLLESFMEKQNIRSKKRARESEEMKQVVRDLRKYNRLKKQGKLKEAKEYFLRAMEKTTKRDGIPPEIDPGESDKFRKKE